MARRVDTLPKAVVTPGAGKKEAAPAGGESGRRAHGPALGGEAGSVLIEAYLHRVLESTAGTRM